MTRIKTLCLCLLAPLALLATACGTSSDDDPCSNNTTCAAENRACVDNQGTAECGSCLTGFHDDQGSCVPDDQVLPVGDYLPAENEVAGWIEDTSRGEPGPESTTDYTIAAQWINGAMERFDANDTWAGLAMEYYINGSMRIKLYIVEMTDAAACTTAYASMEDYSGINNWVDNTFGGSATAGRTGTVFNNWYADAHKGNYFIEIDADPTSEAGLAEAAEAFTAAVLNKLP
jgi:hypothetical protein